MAQCARRGDVADVVARGGRVGSVLSPAGHPAVDEAGVAGLVGLRPEAEALGHPGTEALQQDVGRIAEVQ
jgi:hypothetical protein